MSYFNIISQTMSTMFVRGISEIAELLVSIKRIQTFLLNEEFHDTSLSTTNSKSTNNNIDLEMFKVTAKWLMSKNEDTLENISFCVEKGTLLGVIGPVGSSKSSLLQTILGKRFFGKRNFENFN